MVKDDTFGMKMISIKMFYYLLRFNCLAFFKFGQHGVWHPVRMPKMHRIPFFAQNSNIEGLRSPFPALILCRDHVASRIQRNIWWNHTKYDLAHTFSALLIVLSIATFPLIVLCESEFRIWSKHITAKIARINIEVMHEPSLDPLFSEAKRNSRHSVEWKDFSRANTVDKIYCSQKSPESICSFYCSTENSSKPFRSSNKFRAEVKCAASWNRHQKQVEHPMQGSCTTNIHPNQST